MRDVRQRDRNVHNSLLEVALSILGKMILNHFLDTSSELLPREIEQFLRRRIPFLNYGSDKVFLDDERVIVWKFPSDGPDEVQTKRRNRTGDASLRVGPLHNILNING